VELPPDVLLISVPGPPRMRSTSDRAIPVLSWLYFAIVRAEDVGLSGVGPLVELDEKGVDAGRGGSLRPISLSRGQEQPSTIRKRTPKARFIEFFI
jgi:hypothetical protein